MSCCALCGARIERNFYCANTVSCWMSPKAAVASGRRLRLLSTNVTWLLKCTSGFWLSVCWNGVWLCLLFIVVWVCLCLGVFVRFNRLTRCLATTAKEEGECWYLQAWSAVVVYGVPHWPHPQIHGLLPRDVLAAQHYQGHLWSHLINILSLIQVAFNV